MRVLVLLLSLLALPARADEVICTLVMDAQSAEILLEQGDCDRRTTPASTFKIPLAVMGYDSGFLTSAHEPVLPFRKGDPDWGGAEWQRDTDPAHWMEYSVVWYSQRITHALGADQFAAYVRAFDYGNADLSGDPGRDNGLDRAWIASSLEITPREQARFLRALVRDALPVDAFAMEQARGLLTRHEAGGWNLQGKTGSAYPRRADRSFDYQRGWGWYVGWAEKGDRQLVLVQLTQASKRHEIIPGIRTRDAFVPDWPALVEGL